MQKIKLLKWLPVLGGILVILASRLPWWRRCYDRQPYAWYEWQIVSAGFGLATLIVVCLAACSPEPAVKAPPPAWVNAIQNWCIANPWASSVAAVAALCFLFILIKRELKK